MRNLFASLLCACVAFTFIGCGEKKDDAAKPGDKPAAAAGDKDKKPAEGDKKAEEKPAEEKK